MSPFSPWSECFVGLVGESIALILVVKWTIVLALAWIIHATLLALESPLASRALAHRPSSGIALVALLSSAPPIVKYHFARPGTGRRSFDQSREGWPRTGRAKPGGRSGERVDRDDRPDRRRADDLRLEAANT